MIDLRQLVVLGIALFVPLILLLYRQERLLLLWICFTVCINIFDTTIFVNLLAARVAGLLLIPMALKQVPAILQTRSGRSLAIWFAYTVLLGFVFGVLFPWDATGYDRLFTQTATARAIISLVRLVADLSLAIFVSRQVTKTQNPERVIKYLLLGTSVAAVGGLLQWLFKVDLYYAISGLGGRDLASLDRMRGFNYEPKGLGLISVYGLLLSILLFSHRRSWTLAGIFVLNGIGFYLAVGTSALLTLPLGFAALFLVEKKSRSVIGALALMGVLLVSMFSISEISGLTSWSYYVTQRLSGESRSDLVPTNLVEEIAYRMDVFDAPALLFLADQPFYALIGTGPGLVQLPSTAYLPNARVYEWVNANGQGQNNPPTIGVLFELTNTGLIGIALWTVFVLGALRAFNRLGNKDADDRNQWRIAKGAFAVGVAIYFMQAHIGSSAIWAVFLGLALGAVRQNYSSTVVRSSGLSNSSTRNLLREETESARD